MEPDSLLAAIREARHRISERFDHDPDRLIEHYMQLQQRHKDRLVEMPTEPAEDEVAKRNES